MTPSQEQARVIAEGAPGDATAFGLDDLRRMQRLMETLPPAPLFVSSTFLPPDHAITFKRDGRDFVGAHPTFWAKVPASTRGQYQSLFAIEIIDIDLPANAKSRGEWCAALMANIDILTGDPK